MATRSSVLAWRTPWTDEPGATVHGVAESQTRPALSLFTTLNSAPGVRGCERGWLPLLPAAVLPWGLLSLMGAKGAGVGLGLSLEHIALPS